MHTRCCTVICVHAPEMVVNRSPYTHTLQYDTSYKISLAREIRWFLTETPDRVEASVGRPDPSLARTQAVFSLTDGAERPPDADKAKRTEPADNLLAVCVCLAAITKVITCIL